MQLPEPYWNWLPIRDANQKIVGYEHSVLVLLPWRRYRREVVPFPIAESPSEIFLGEETRFGVELSVVRRLSCSNLPDFVGGQMEGELAEAWVMMTLGID